MPGDQVDEIVRIVEGYLGGRLRGADWRLWLRRREEAARAVVPSEYSRLMRSSSATS
jgi:hypothetical protein